MDNTRFAKVNFSKKLIFILLHQKKDPTSKAELHLKYKSNRNLLSILLKRSEQSYYKKYFESNLSNSKNTWKGIKSIITMKNVISTVPKTLSHGKNTITNPCEIANVFNNYFSSVNYTAKQNIDYSHKHFSEYLKHIAIILYLSNRQTMRK